MNSKRIFVKYRRKKERYIRRLEKVWEEELSAKEALALAKGCSDILDSVISMAKDLGQLDLAYPWSASPLDSMSDEELERYLEKAKTALLKESAGDLEAPGQD